MEPMEYVALAAAALKLGQALVPQIKELIEGGTLTEEQEQEARSTYAALRAAGGDAFSGSEYELSGR